MKRNVHADRLCWGLIYVAIMGLAVDLVRCILLLADCN